ncbi:ADP-ribosylglycohydrolase family protein [Streptobacillus ratti]|uniref:ADP-ribosylglycohydrolase family protein n=1 Tax=Streptobacillus ratti TaxID=1720557 RepID=UPI001ABF43A7|nr:ADP-ribosylglycohydrolase family protein [Streptobacillus ratti]
MRNRFNNWLYKGEYTTDKRVFDVGITTRQALDSGQGLDDFFSNGNGSLMRILPLVFINSTNDEIDEVSAITHAHSISKEACRIYVNIIKSLVQKKNLRDILDNLECSEHFSRLKYLYTLKEEEIKSTGYVVDTLEASLWCVLTPNSFEESVLKAINLGDDTDTIGAITGGLSGIIYGFNNIPKDWIEKLRNKEEIEEYLFYII